MISDNKLETSWNGRISRKTQPTSTSQEIENLNVFGTKKEIKFAILQNKNKQNTNFLPEKARISELTDEFCQILEELTSVLHKLFPKVEDEEVLSFLF